MADRDDDATKDGARKAILARRARFVAAAMAGVGIACGKTTSPPQPCLEPVMVDDAATPMPCLAPPPAEPPDAGAADAPTPAPMPCLSVAAPPPDKPPTKKKPR